ncbi:MAG: hypothetical protein JW870_14265 [Candidatus Delongbacteria bacterium]|nr:hypothetical protein [Candidatus Delongbacteria bacterium]
MKVSSLKFTIEGVTATEVVGGISVCLDGYYTIIGKAPDGSNLAIQIGKMLVGETRSICTEEEFENCIENGGIGLTAAALEDVYTSISGSAKRTNTNDIEVSGVARKMSDGTEHAFTLEATASLVSPINCE